MDDGGEAIHDFYDPPIHKLPDRGLFHALEDQPPVRQGGVQRRGSSFPASFTRAVVEAYFS